MTCAGHVLAPASGHLGGHEQWQTKVLAIPTASISVLEAGRYHLAANCPPDVMKSSTNLALEVDSSTSRVSHQAPICKAALGPTGPPSTTGSGPKGRR